MPVTAGFGTTALPTLTICWFDAGTTSTITVTRDRAREVQDLYVKCTILLLKAPEATAGHHDLAHTSAKC